MTTRSKTLLFLQYRSSSRGPRRPGGGGLDTSESAGLIANEAGSADEVALEMSVLPPKWVDIVDEVDEDIDLIKNKMLELDALHKKHLLPGFDDRIGDEQSIERMTGQITAMFTKCQRKIKRIEDETRQAADSGSRQAAVLGKNIQTSLAVKLQEVSSAFRKAQGAYLAKLRGNETRSKDLFHAGGLSDTAGGSGDPFADDAGGLSDSESLDAVFTDAQMAVVATNERMISEREAAINDIVRSIHALAEVFKELQTMVIDQGTVLDRIDYNIEQVNVHMEAAHGQLVQGSKYQEKTKAKLLIIFLSLVVFILLVIIFYKLIKRK
ncbi:t-SNARE [Zopfochytrium polystomum]|nr:t-SNARE [Zopfochytrium polystomum]